MAWFSRLLRAYSKADDRLFPPDWDLRYILQNIKCTLNQGKEVEILFFVLSWQVWIFEESEDGDSNMYVHHDIILPAFPLCTAWLDCNPKGGDKGEFASEGHQFKNVVVWSYLDFHWFGRNLLSSFGFLYRILLLPPLKSIVEIVTFIIKSKKEDCTI